MRWWRRNRPARPVMVSDPTLESLRLSLDGWSEQKVTDVSEPVRLWINGDESAITIGVVKDHYVTARRSTPSWSLQHWARFFARDSGGGLIEADHIELTFGPALRFIFKTREHLASMYHGQLCFARNDVDVFISVVCKELGTTGVREAVITAELIEQGRLDLKEYRRIFARDPYDPGYDGVDQSVLRFMSDDETYDSRFPDHPLSKVRRLLAVLPPAIAFDA